jgi:hypothetical protein
MVNITNKTRRKQQRNIRTHRPRFYGEEVKIDAKNLDADIEVIRF